MATGGGMGTGAAAGVRPLDLSDSVVKEIVELSIGKTAAQELATQSSRRIGFGGGMMGEGSSFGESGGSFGESGGGFGGGGFGGGGDFDGGGMNAEALRSAALAGRYVDESGNPLSDVDLTGQFRRMPIFLRFIVDQKRIADVLANCANCPMPIDVLWVTINPDATGPFEFVSATGAGMGGGSESSFSSFSMRPPGGAKASSFSSFGGGGVGTTAGIIGLSNQGGGQGMGTGRVGEIDYGHDAVTIDIYGCINIFAPPDKTKITEGE